MITTEILKEKEFEVFYRDQAIAILDKDLKL